MNLVDIDDGIALGGSPLHNRLQALFKLTSEFCARYCRAHVELIDAATLQSRGHLASLDAGSQAIDNRRLAHSWLAQVKRVVLVAAAQHLDGALPLGSAPYERVVACEVVVDAQHIGLPCSLAASFLLGLARCRGSIVASVLIAVEQGCNETALVAIDSLSKAVGRP